MLKATFIAIGDEILDGRTINTNAAMLAKQWKIWGGNAVNHFIVGDDISRIKEVLHYISTLQIDVVFTIGGLGPTSDDKTREALANTYQWEFIEEKEWHQYLTRRYPSVTQSVLQTQSLYPKEGLFFRNSEGTALGFAKQEKEMWIVALPGVPLECEQIFRDVITSTFKRSLDSLAQNIRRTISLYGISERTMDDFLYNLECKKEGLSFTWGLYPQDGCFSVVLDGKLDSIEIIECLILSAFQPFIMSYDFIDECLGSHQSIYFIDESITCGLIQWRWSLSQVSSVNRPKVIFTRQEKSDYQVFQKSEDGFDKIILMRNGEVLGQQFWPADGSLQKRQERCYYSVFGIIKQWVIDENIIENPYKWLLGLSF